MAMLTHELKTPISVVRLWGSRVTVAVRIGGTRRLRWTTSMASLSAVSCLINWIRGRSGVSRRVQCRAV